MSDIKLKGKRMKLLRSMFFGCIAMLAAAFCLSTPAAAFDVSPAVYAVKLTISDYDVPDVFKADVITVGITSLPDRSTNSHAVEYNIQNQPNSAFRLAVDTYKHIDPHIAAGR
ncbi:hypothetical protein [Pseudochrobactrum sp. XF203]|uniref:hypothetical protein n=1 Tax=Pseudochrobactrum sp. XF203 TaxID=2879116 RepID=UPI001CE341F4|nr:hypothetical protein [Pseudochrobactrum sp. XF203]UCA47723.1 hypothetical protein LDL70_16885 [Pseudochrobactrum sp. XF203]